MALFSKKSIMQTATLGERLREVREESRCALAEASQATGVPQHHLEALERGDYDRLPGDIYVRNFLRRYAQFLKLNEERVLESYAAERALVKPTERRLPGPAPTHTSLTLTLATKRIAIGAVALAVLVYLGVELRHILAAPNLAVDEPASSIITRSPVIDVAGRTDPEAAVVINGQAVQVAEDGRFRESVTLHPGRNTIQVTAVKKRGKRYTISREVVLEGQTPPPATSESEAPAAATP